ncbi:MAG: hypothetical protein DCC58_02605 [Chloroflexi bacterium]|nr:MAG: hypothetical protein DCC58_02605 [Chloroflexota bacterium]
MTPSGSNRLSGLRAIVTGAGQGIGAAIAIAFAQAGATLVLNDWNADTVQRVADEIRLIGTPVLSVTGDVSEPSTADALVSQAAASYGGLDVLVNNAGIGGVGKTILETDLAEWERFLRIDLTSVFLLCRAAVPAMRASGGGSIVNISSITGLTGAAGSVPYGAAKAGVIGLTRSLAREVAVSRIRVNAIAPGLIDTDMSRARGQEAARAAVLWPRIGQPEDIAHLAVYLASPEAEFVTGQVLSVNGGALM